MSAFTRHRGYVRDGGYAISYSLLLKAREPPKTIRESHNIDAVSFQRVVKLKATSAQRPPPLWTAYISTVSTVQLILFVELLDQSVLVERPAKGIDEAE